MRLWSRPLVALLFFLQPIVRGWARYQGRLSVQKRRLSEYESLDSLSRHARTRNLKELQYWDERCVGRIRFLQVLMERLDKRDWPNKMDEGWNSYDLEIYGSRWSHLQLITVSEMLGGTRQLIRCRLRPAWTLLARTLFWGLTGLELLLIGFLAPFFPWLWTVLLTLPVLVWLFYREERNLRRLMAVFLDEVAKDLGLTPIPAPKAPLEQSAAPEPVPVTPACQAVNPSLALKSPDRV